MWKSKWLGENRTSRENASFCMFAVYEDDCKVGYY